MTRPTQYTTGDAARLYGCPIWLMRQIFDQLEPPPQRIGGYRVIHDNDLKKVEAALRQIGRLPAEIAVPG